MSVQVSPYKVAESSLASENGLKSISHDDATLISNALWNIYALVDNLADLEEQTKEKILSWFKDNHDRIQTVHNQYVNLALSLEKMHHATKGM
jgi:K+-sensing histidine kinase KdpD